MLFIQKGNSQFDDHAAFSCIIGRTQEEYLFLQGLVSLSCWISQELKLLSILYMNITKYFQICSLGEPQDSGISLQTVLELGPTIPIFGVCMGLQCIGEAFGGNIYLYTSSLVCSRPDLVSQTFMYMNMQERLSVLLLEWCMEKALQFITMRN